MRKSKFTEEQKQEIRNLAATNNFTQKELALKFNVTSPTIARIIKQVPITEIPKVEAASTVRS